MKQERRHHNGFILLLVLLILPVIAVATVSVARMSLRAAAEAQSAQSNLQRKWAQVSCTAVFLPQAGSVLGEPGDVTGDNQVDQATSDGTTLPATGPAISTTDPNEMTPFDVLDDPDAPISQPRRASVVHAVTLGGLDFELTFADEQAKLNVNLLYQELGEMQTLAVLETVQSSARDEVQFDLRPYARTGTDGVKSRAFASFGQVYRAVTPRLPADAPDQETDAPAITDLITCWGGGQLNVRRATPEAVELVARLALKPGEVERLLAALAKAHEAADDQDLAAALDALGLTEKRRSRVGELLVDRSACYSLGMTHQDDHRTWRWLAVQERDESAVDVDNERTDHVVIDGILDPEMKPTRSASMGHAAVDHGGRGGTVYVFAW